MTESEIKSVFENSLKELLALSDRALTPKMDFIIPRMRVKYPNWSVQLKEGTGNTLIIKDKFFENPKFEIKIRL